MDPKPSPERFLLAPSGAGPRAYHCPDGAGPPRVDERLVRPETREEMVRGRLVHALPAREPHADRHLQLDFVIRGCVAPGYIGSTDLLTRAGEASDFATDTCIRREGIDPETDARYLEELAFEIVNTQTLSDITERAEELTKRGVRRVIAIFVKKGKGEVREWSPKTGEWTLLDPDDPIKDRTLTHPLPVRALLQAAAADEAVVRALQAKRSPAIVAIETASVNKGIEQGIEQGIEKGIEAICDVLGIPFDGQQRAQVHALDAAGREELLELLRTTRRWPSR